MKRKYCHLVLRCRINVLQIKLQCKKNTKERMYSENKDSKFTNNAMPIRLQMWQLISTFEIWKFENLKIWKFTNNQMSIRFQVWQLISTFELSLHWKEASRPFFQVGLVSVNWRIKKLGFKKSIGFGFVQIFGFVTHCHDPFPSWPCVSELKDKHSCLLPPDPIKI